MPWMTESLCFAQMSFNDFLHRCEMLDFDFDPKMVAQGRMHTRDIAKLKVPSESGNVLLMKQ